MSFETMNTLAKIASSHDKTGLKAQQCLKWLLEF